MRCPQVFFFSSFILLRMGVPWVCRMEHTFLLFLSLLVFLWVYQLVHRPSLRPFGHQGQPNGGPFPSSCFYYSFSLPFLFLDMSWNSNNIFLLGDAVQTDAVFTVKHLFGRQTGIHCTPVLLAPCSAQRRILVLRRSCFYCAGTT